MKWTHVYMEASTRQGGFSDFLMACGINSEKFFDHIVSYCFDDKQPETTDLFIEKLIPYLKEATAACGLSISKNRCELSDVERQKALLTSSKVVEQARTMCSEFELSDLDIDFIRGQADAYLRLTQARAACESQD